MKPIPRFIKVSLVFDWKEKSTFSFYFHLNNSVILSLTQIRFKSRSYIKEESFNFYFPAWFMKHPHKMALDQTLS